MEILNQISALLQRGKAKDVKTLVSQAIEEGIPAATILNEGLLSGMNVVGQRFKNNEIFVPEVLIAARAMNMGAALLKPLLADEGVKAAGKVCIGTVKGDLHDIGKNLVIMMIESTGYEVVDLGIDVPVDTFLEAANDPEVTVIGVSALLTTTMGAMQETVAALNKHPRRAEFKIMVGGAPITEAFAKEIGADVYTEDAASAGQAAKALAQ